MNRLTASPPRGGRDLGPGQTAQWGELEHLVRTWCERSGMVEVRPSLFARPDPAGPPAPSDRATEAGAIHGAGPWRDDLGMALIRMARQRRPAQDGPGWFSIGPIIRPGSGRETMAAAWLHASNGNPAVFVDLLALGRAIVAACGLHPTIRLGVGLCSRCPGSTAGGQDPGRAPTDAGNRRPPAARPAGGPGGGALGGLLLGRPEPDWCPSCRRVALETHRLLQAATHPDACPVQTATAAPLAFFGELVIDKTAPTRSDDPLVIVREIGRPGHDAATGDFTGFVGWLDLERLFLERGDGPGSGRCRGGDETPAPADLSLVWADPAAFPVAFRLMHALRRSGFAVHMSLTDRSLRSQFRAAHRTGGRWVLLIDREALTTGWLVVHARHDPTVRRYPFDRIDELAIQLRRLEATATPGEPPDRTPLR